VNKPFWLDVAEVLDALRVFPRLILFSAFCFTAWYAWYALSLAVSVIDAAADPSLASGIVGGAIGITVPFVGSMFAKVADIYMNTGREWSPRPPSEPQSGTLHTTQRVTP
jgi:hypothetical protein